MIQHTRRAWMAAVAVGAATAAVIPFSAAVSQQSPPRFVIDLELAATGTFGARGAVAFVTMQYTCPLGAELEFVSVELSQRSGSSIVHGFGFDQQLLCDGTIQDATVSVLASTGRGFKKGPAFARAEAVACDSLGCVSDDDEGEIRLVRA